MSFMTYRTVVVDYSPDLARSPKWFKNVLAVNVHTSVVELRFTGNTQTLIPLNQVFEISITEQEDGKE